MMIAPFLRQRTPVALILFTRVIVAGSKGSSLHPSQDGYTVKSSRCRVVENFYGRNLTRKSIRFDQI